MSGDNTNYDDYSISDVSVTVITTATSLSKMSDEQTSELKELEREYEDVLDENCRALAEYLKQVLENEDDDHDRLIEPPPLILKNQAGKVEVFDGSDELEEDQQSWTRRSTGEIGISTNGRYNVMFIIFLTYSLIY